MINELLINDIRQWGFDKGILNLENLDNHEDLRNLRLAQAEKTKEELRELFDAIESDNREEARDAIGDVIVTLIMQAELWDTGIGSCLYDAYQEIKGRTGKMVDGQFVKDTA